MAKEKIEDVSGAPPKAEEIPKHPDDVQYYLNVSSVAQGVNDLGGDYRIIPPGALFDKKYIGARMASTLPWISPFLGKLEDFTGIVIK